MQPSLKSSRPGTGSTPSPSSPRRYDGFLGGFGDPELHNFLAGILIASPVAGFRPIRAFLSDRTNRPIPGSTNTPFFFTSVMAVWANVVIRDPAAFFVISHFSASA